MFVNPLGLLALLALPAVFALHYFRRRYRRRVTSALFLWGGGERTPASGRTRERLIRSPSLLAELLAALALALALAGPRCSGPREVPHLVAVIDGSASMAAELPGGSPAERATTALRARLDELPGDARVTLIESGPEAAVRVGPGGLARELGDFLGGWQPAAARHDLGDALTLALRLASSRTPGADVAVELYTDRFEPERQPDLVGVQAFGRPAPNVAIVGAHRSREAGAESISIVVANLGDAVATRTLRAFTAPIPADSPLLEREVELVAGGRSHLQLALPEGTGAVRLALDGDLLAVDDQAFLAPAPPRTVSIASELDAATERLLGLSSAGGSPLDHLFELVPDVRLAGADEVAQLALVEADSNRGSNFRLVLHAPAAGEATRSWVGPFLVERATPPLDGLTLEGVVWTGHEQSPLPGAPVVAAGSQALVTRVERSGGVDLHLDLDPTRSTLQRSPDWPILLANLIEQARRALPGPRATNLRAGEALVWLVEEPGTYTLRGPLDQADSGPVAAEQTTDKGRELRFATLERPGIYALERDGERVALLGQSFADESVSELRERSSGERQSAAQVASVAISSDRVSAWLAALALLAVAFDIWTLRGRRGGGVA
ncbi:vWA domain-containing protein [Engelhardtia mirabilis]|uniref:Aerotolerance regulator N-terminal domain-containing protein n=1 Tax=Engelhardtia mirabilis TaxID=2528011 RepID=A0A518BIL3_9BACT|nr:hypothetical protein Pla133_18810 [Planctomycetes bacterium Pla133]QDV01131.1 hypothetical protein Pla86_18800 [Planctomycetes bacterium Pla86]